MKNQNLKDQPTFYAALLVGGIGAIGQAMLLQNTLVWSYPFKMMDMPPSEFYARIGYVGACVSPAVAIAAALFFRSAKGYLIPAIPVVLCPLLYWLIFETFFCFSPYQGARLLERNFEGYTGETARYAFSFEVLALAFWGTVIGLVAGWFIHWLSKLFARRLA